MDKFKILLVISTFILVTSCAKKEESAITIDKIKVTKSEFESAFEKYNIGQEATLAQRKAFLNTFINRKLILKDAEALGLDKDKAFLEDIQGFWEQSLLKRTVDRKTRELFMTIKISDKEINDFYNSNKEKFGGRDLSAVYPEIRTVLFREKQKKAIEQWLEGLKNKADIKINNKLLGLE